LERFLLHCAGLLAQDAPLEHASQEYQLQAQDISRELGGLPLALEQAGAYLDETGTNLASYFQIYKQHRIQLLKKNQPLTYPNTVATTWEISFHNVEQRDPAAADLLRYCAFLAPDVIPEEILAKGAEALGPLLSPIANDAYLFDQSIATLRAYSFVTRDPREHTLAIHRLIQAVVRDNLDPSQQHLWVERVIDTMNKAIPESSLMLWQAWLPYLSQVYRCSQLIDEYSIVSENAGNLLSQGGAMLRYYSRPAEAEMMYERALHIFERALRIRERTLGAEHPDTLTTINSIALLYSHWHHFEDAQRTYERALRICERVLGSEHPDTAMTLANIAMLFRAWRKYPEAEDFFERALRIRERFLGPVHPTTISTLNNLAGIYRLQCKYEQAEHLFKRVLHIQEQTVGHEHPATATTISNLAYLYSYHADVLLV
jgi:tetratricopeptide (TPR) repeat protein